MCASEIEDGVDEGCWFAGGDRVVEPKSAVAGKLGGGEDTAVGSDGDPIARTAGGASHGECGRTVPIQDEYSNQTIATFETS